MRSAISNLRFAIRGDQASDDDDGDVTVGYWVWFAGVWFWFVYWRFYFLINTFMFGLLEFVLLLYWGLISLPAMTRHDGFHF